MSFLLDLSEFERVAGDLNALADQIPFALANAMTTAAFKTKEALVAETWPSHVKVRNSRFLSAALRIEKARKTALRVGIFDHIGRDFLVLHAKGGAKVARKSAIAIPERKVASRRRSKGVPTSLRPKDLPDAFRVPGKKGGELIYQRFGRYEPSGTRKKPGVNNRHLRLMYVLEPSTTIKSDVPFEADFEHVMTREVRKAFPIAIANAMKTRGLTGRYERQAALGRRANSSHGNSTRARTT